MSVKSFSVMLAALLASSSALSQESWSGLRAPAPSSTVADSAPFALAPKAKPATGWPASRPQAARLAEPARAPQARVPAAVDDTALRYYASQNDTARVAAEIRRIRLVHPDWTPPADLFEGGSDSGEEQALWKLFAEGKLDEIKDQMAAIQEKQPNWRPSPDFATKFEQALARRDLVTASDAGDSATVLSIAEARPQMMVCAEMDVLWRVAEALAKTGTQDKAFDLYRYIMARCPDAQERLATVQKASLVLPTKMTEKLLAVGPRAGERASFESARLDLFRRRIGETINGGGEIAATDLKAFETSAEQRRSADDAALLGWLRFSKKDYPGAARWFKAAMGYAPLAKAIEGYALSLREQGQLADAEKVSYENRKADPLIAQLYVEILATDLTRDPMPTIEAERLTRMAAVVDETKSVTGSQALGWYYYRSGEARIANDWFKRSVAWQPIEANVLGLALSSHKLNDRAAFKAAIAEYGSKFPSVASLARMDAPVKVASAPRGRKGGRGGSGGSALANEAVSLFKAGKYQEALAALDKRGGSGREDQGLQLLRGWSLYHTGQWAKAKEHFEAMDARNSTHDTQYGKFYANERLIAPQFRAN